MEGRRRPVGVLAVLGAALFCIPCLIPLVLVAASVIGFAAIGSWFSENGLVLGAAAAVAVLGAGVGVALYVRRRQAAAREVDIQPGNIAPVQETGASGSATASLSGGRTGRSGTSGYD